MAESDRRYRARLLFPRRRRCLWLDFTDYYYTEGSRALRDGNEDGDR